MKIYIEYSNSKKPYGGGNQFLNNLQNFLKKKNNYTNKPEKADVILINAFENLKKVIELKIKFQNKVFIHRVDGITRLYNNTFDLRDHLTYVMNKYVAVATIFQSRWCKIYNKKFGLGDKKYEKTILNSVDKKIFKNKNKNKNIKNKKFVIIASSWSSNWNKGFYSLDWLDKNLNFKKYDFIFIGNSPIKFTNIKMVSPVKSKILNNYLSKSDVYLSTSKKDACSNSILEALACGLPIVALNDGGNPEIVKKCGELYRTKEEMLVKIKKIQNNYKKYKFFINKKKKETCKEYLDFISYVFKKKPIVNNLNISQRFKIKLIKLNVCFFSILSKLLNNL